MNGDLALTYAVELGWFILPLHSIVEGKCTCQDHECKSPGKHPRIKMGLGMEAATKDPKTIREWWGKWPDANVGIATGQSNLAVLDVDPKSGGSESFSRLVAQFPELTKAPRVKTGSDGLHAYFSQPMLGEAIRNSASAILPGIDMRGVGGLVVAPGSNHISGKRYEWVKGFDPFTVAVNEPSMELATLMRTAKRQAMRKVQDQDGQLFVPKGARNDMVTSVVGILHSRGIGKEAIEACMTVFNAKQMEMPLTERELSTIINSVTRYPRK